MSVQLIVNEDPSEYKQRIFDFVSSFPDAVILDSNIDKQTPIPFTGTQYSFIAAAGINTVVDSTTMSFDKLQDFIDQCKINKEWIFGFLSYDLKNEFENLTSDNEDVNRFPLFHFFTAKHIFIAEENKLTIIDSADCEKLWENIKINSDTEERLKPVIQISHVLNRESYLASVKKLLEHIRRGDIYEINYCHQLVFKTRNFDAPKFSAQFQKFLRVLFLVIIQPEDCSLSAQAPNDLFAVKNDLLISQPIKGTAARSKDGITDAQNLSLLMNSDKERSENIMIVDLVRNDLSRVAKKGTVKVEELCGIYSFPKVHQLISTISCRIKEGIKFTDIIRALFPMGSMTGAPKISAMKLIESEENFKRTLFSGSVGYIDPSGNFDFNVIIRSILYSQHTSLATLAAGGAITMGSIPEQEYEETLLKLKPQLEAMGLDPEIILKQFSNDAV